MSLRIRLLLAVGAVAILALFAADIATYSALRSFLYKRIDQQLDAAHVPIERSGGRASVTGVFAAVRSADGTLTPIGQTFSRFTGDQLTPRLPAITTFTATDEFGEHYRLLTVHSVEKGGPSLRVRTSPLADGSQLILAMSLEDVTGTLQRLLGIELLVTAGALATAAAVGWWLVRLGLRPLAAVEETAAAITAGDLDRRVPGDDANTEVGQVAQALNTMLDQIQGAFAERDATEARLRRFVADASHELRTPLAAVSAYAELFERGASQRPEDLARVLTGIRAETARMRDLVEDLLLLARLDEGRPLDRAQVELVGLAAEAVDAAIAVGPAWPAHLEASQPVEVTGDKTRLRQVLDNLLANVRAHTPPGTAATVAISMDNQDAVITVADRGPGLGDEPGRVFERFYRADKSRSRQLGGTGLGLAIVSGIVAAHGGSVAAANNPGGGAAFTVRLPAQTSDDDAGAGGDGVGDAAVDAAGIGAVTEDAEANGTPRSADIVT